MSTTYLSAEAIRGALTIRDLTNPDQGPHGIQLLIDELEEHLSSRWTVSIRRARAHAVVSVAENYDRLLIPRDAIAREARYTRYLNDEAVLRTHTSAMIPALLEELAEAPDDLDVLLSCPGLVYRRDSIGRQHVGEPHQMDLWRIKTTSPALTTDDLEEMISLVVSTAAPGRRWREVPREHAYTTHGRQIDVKEGQSWVEIAECGLANPELLAASGLQVPPASGLAMGLGLDRLLMLRKGVDDIRLLRSKDPRVADQMQDLTSYRQVSSMPPVRRDLSIAVEEELTEEELGDRVRLSLGSAVDAVEAIEVVSETPYSELPPPARERLGINAGQKNVLLRVAIRSLERTLTDDEGNRLRDRIYAALHEGSVKTWASESPYKLPG